MNSPGATAGASVDPQALSIDAMHVAITKRFERLVRRFGIGGFASIDRYKTFKILPVGFSQQSPNNGAIRVAHEYTQRLEVPFRKIGVVSPESGNYESIVFLVLHIADVDFHERTQRDYHDIAHYTMQSVKFGN